MDKPRFFPKWAPKWSYDGRQNYIFSAIWGFNGGFGLFVGNGMWSILCLLLAGAFLYLGNVAISLPGGYIYEKALQQTKDNQKKEDDT